jgi:hypothetical protein
MIHYSMVSEHMVEDVAEHLAMHHQAIVQVKMAAQVVVV